MPQPGWYSDPEMRGTRRYWDGYEWTEHIAPESQDEGLTFWMMLLLAVMGTAAVVVAILVFLG